MADEISYKKLSDASWGISGRNLTVGQTVTVTKRSGETKSETVAAIVWRGSNGLCYASIVTTGAPRSSSSQSTPTNTTRRSSSGSGGRRRSRREPKHEGVKEGKYCSSREGDEGDTVGRVCYLKSQGKRIPVVVVGWETDYCKEDGLSFGLPMDEGYYTQMWYRDATEQEAKDLATEEETKKAAKDNAAQAAKQALEAAMNTARAPLEGLTKSDSLSAPKGTRTQVGSYKNGFGHMVYITKIELESGLVVYPEMISMYDDQRDYIWGTDEALNVLYEQRLAENPVTLEEAQTWLAKNYGCYGSSLYQYIVDKARS